MTLGRAANLFSRIQNQGKAVPPVHKSLPRHSTHAAIGVVRINHPHFLRAKFNERDDVSSTSRRALAETNDCPSILADRVSKDFGAEGTAVLDTVIDVCLYQDLLQVFGPSTTSVLFGEAVEGREVLMAG